ncbi:MAG: amidohydrolase [Chloroflexi bacterium]|nr:amidohydrolase [Chloroflexota bacterium]
MRGDRVGPTVLVRAEMDALPIHEISDVAYRSRHHGVMHACGHDAHTTIATVVAERLAKCRDELRGTIRFAFQPAEEIAGGAVKMIEEGAIENPAVDAAIALHVLPELAAGTVAVASGPVWAAVDELRWTVRGKSGHAAYPHQHVDTIVVAAQIVTALQTVVSRSSSPFTPAVLSIGSIHGGTTWNVIPEYVEMHGTLRTFDPQVRERLMERMRAISTGVAMSMEATCEVEDRYSAPPVVNDGELALWMRDTLVPLHGEDQVAVSAPSAGGDDFAFFAERSRGCVFHLGVRNVERGITNGLHNSGFDLDEGALPVGAASLDAILRTLLARI